ncbi:MAG: LysR substrate-binding domain-containing protein [Alphaproteobacteria bacterium]|nr:LysR substrate-binding domain-containing protein [Alphaproteobacteria bacterium]
MKAIPTLRQLQYLLALKETKNFRKAAEKCHITQPTLSAAIKEIEKLLGVSVIDRSQHKNVIFTPFGKNVIEAAQKIMPHIESLMSEAQHMTEPLSGFIRLGLIPTIAPYLLPSILPQLQKKFPKIDFQINEAISQNLVEKLHNGDIDLALMAFPYETEGLNQKILMEEPFYCATSKNSFQKNQKLAFKDLDGQRLLLLEDGHCLRDHALSACKLQNQTDKKTFSATSLPTLIQMVGQGYGITLLPEMVIQQGVLPKNVVLHAFKKPYPMRKIGVAWRQKDPQEQNILEIIKHLEENLSQTK